MGSLPAVRQLAAGVFVSAICLGAASPVSAATDEATAGRVEFQRRANAICATYNRKVASLGSSMTPTIVERWTTLTRAQTRALATLTPPAGSAIRYRKILAISRTLLPLALETF